jgi:UDP-N-acetyl-D-mannosaminuronate dehydrogenase
MFAPFTDVIRELASYGATVHVHDPVADPAEARHEYGVELESWDALPQADAVVAAVAHGGFIRLTTAEGFRRRKGNVRHLQADITKARRLLDTRLACDVRSGLAAALPWYEHRR